MRQLRVAINGFGRIGRSFYKATLDRDDLEVVVVNDLGDIDNKMYLLQYDTAQGRENYDITVAEDKKGFVVDGHHVAYVSDRDPANLPWGEMNIDVVVESTGFFTTYEGSSAHLSAGAKRVVISAPAKGEPVPGIESATVLMGINHDKLQTCQISSNGSCTTNSSSPIVQILHETVGVEKAMLTTVHSYTSTQKLVDLDNPKDYRKGRAAAQNIIPTTTGAAVAVTEVITDLKGKFDGMAMRVPTIAGSVSDITFISKRDTTVEEINTILTEAAQSERWNKVFSVTNDPIVSSDIIGSTFASIADLGMTKVVDGNLVKVLGWYDNEMGYTRSLVEHVVETGSYL